jgi:ABC-type uncharacterized transport system substrate-binding protein
MPVIGFLNSASLGQIDAYLAAFRHGLAETGYAEGQNVSIEYRWAENHYDRLPGLAALLVGREVDAIATNGGEPSAFAARKATSTIPIVFVVGQNQDVPGKPNTSAAQGAFDGRTDPDLRCRGAGGCGVRAAAAPWP